MDTKLKKTHKKLKVFIILMTIVLPTIVLPAFYPRLEKLANKQYDETIANYNNEIIDEKNVCDEFVLDAISFLKLEYAKELRFQEKITEDELLYILNNGEIENNANNILYQYIPYCHYMCDAVNYKDNVMGDSEELREIAIDMINDMEFRPYDSDMWSHDIVGYYIVEYDENCELIKNEFVATTGYDYYANTEFVESLYDDISLSNVKAVFFLTQGSSYANETHYVNGWYSYEQAYWDIGAPVLIIAAAVLVAFVALLLPFIKSLNTGNEKLFSLPVEIVFVLLLATVWAMIGMFFAMTYTNLDFWQQELGDVNDYILGYRITPNFIYRLLLVANVVAWLLCFFMEYIVVSALRQFISHPLKYIKERSLIYKLAVKVFKWIKGKVKGLTTKVKDIISTWEANRLLVLALVVNLVVGIIACVCFIGGIPLFIIYTIAVYLFLYKKYMNVQKQYNVIKDSVHKMAEGDFDIHIDEDLGVFQPITDELVKVKAGFEKALIEEAKSEHMKTELVTNVSHDLKTPLTAIITYVDLLKKEDITSEERKQYVETLDMKSQRLKVLIEDLFEVSKANSGNVRMNIMDVDVVGLLKQVRLELEDKISESRIDFRWNMPDEKIVLQLDGQRTYRIFANLINNICKYSLTGSRAYAAVKSEDDRVVVTFKNISAEEIQCDASNLTERFVRGDASRNSEGSGLGLAIAKSFTELQGGSFNIEVDGDLFKVTIEWSK